MPAARPKQYCSMWNCTTPGDDQENLNLNGGISSNGLFAAARYGKFGVLQLKIAHCINKFYCI